jgi:hypothetical protein
LECPNRGLIIQEPVWQFGPNTISDCIKLKKKFSAAYFVTVGSGAASDLINALNIALSLDAQAKILIDVKNNNNQLFSCNGNSPNYSVARSSIDCVRYCPTWETDFEGNPILAGITYNSCGTACCLKRRKFCYDYSTNPATLNIEEVETGTFDGGCSPLNNKCTGNNYVNCNAPCDRI